MAARKKKQEPVVEQPLIAFKGFNHDWTCRDFQYEVGGTYKHDGEVAACQSGFHACEFPLDVLGYYAPVSDNGVANRFAVVECSGTLARHVDDSKVAAAQLTVKAEIKIPELVNYAVRCDQHGQPVRCDQHGPPVRCDQHGRLVRCDQHGRLVRCDQHGPLVRCDR